MHTPFWLIFPSRINWAPIPVGVPTVLAIPLKPFLSPIVTSELFLIILLPFFSIRKICCIAIRSVSPVFNDNFFSSKFTRFSINDFDESQIYDIINIYCCCWVKHFKIFESLYSMLPFLFLLIV